MRAFLSDKDGIGTNTYRILSTAQKEDIPQIIEDLKREPDKAKLKSQQNNQQNSMQIFRNYREARENQLYEH